MASHAEVQKRIDDLQQKLDDTLESASFNRGPVQDSIRVTVPMIKDQLDVLRELLALIKQ